MLLNLFQLQYQPDLAVPSGTVSKVSPTAFVECVAVLNPANEFHTFVAAVTRINWCVKLKVLAVPESSNRPLHQDTDRIDGFYAAETQFVGRCLAGIQNRVNDSVPCVVIVVSTLRLFDGHIRPQLPLRRILGLQVRSHSKARDDRGNDGERSLHKDVGFRPGAFLIVGVMLLWGACLVVGPMLFFGRASLLAKAIGLLLFVGGTGGYLLFVFRSLGMDW